MSRKLRRDAQPYADQEEQHDIYKVPAQNVIRDGKRKERICDSRADGALSRGHCPRETIQRAQ